MEDESVTITETYGIDRNGTLVSHEVTPPFLHDPATCWWCLNHVSPIVTIPQQCTVITNAKDVTF